MLKTGMALDRPSTRCDAVSAEATVASLDGARAVAAASLVPASAHQCEEMLAIPSRLPENAGLASGDGLLVQPGRNASSPSVSGTDAGTKVSVVAVAQLVRVPDCDSGGRGFESPQPPH